MRSKHQFRSKTDMQSELKPKQWTIQIKIVKQHELKPKQVINEIKHEFR